jgi:hypothetical protein
MKCSLQTYLSYFCCIVEKWLWLWLYTYICGKGVKDKNVNSKCTHRQMTRLWLTKNKPGLSSEREPHRDKTTNFRSKHLKGKQYLVNRSQSELDTKTYWQTDRLTVSRKVTLTLTVSLDTALSLKNVGLIFQNEKTEEYPAVLCPREALFHICLSFLSMKSSVEVRWEGQADCGWCMYLQDPPL